MSENFRRYLLYTLAVCCFTLAAVNENNLFHKHPEELLIRKFQEKLSREEVALNRLLYVVALEIPGAGDTTNFHRGLYEYSHTFEKEGFGLLVCKDGQPVYWSDRTIPFQDYSPGGQENTGLFHLKNGYYLVIEKKAGQFTLSGFILLKYDYIHENKYLVNEFRDGFKLPSTFLIESAQKRNTFPVYGRNGDYFFSINPQGVIRCTKSQLFFPAFLYVLGLIILFAGIRAEFKRSDNSVPYKLVVLAAGLFVFYWLHVLFKIPKVFYIMGFFSPDYFAVSIWLPTLGDFFIVSVFFFFWAINFGYDFRLKHLLKSGTLSVQYVIALLLLACGSFFLLVNYLIRLLLQNSSFSFSLDQINDLSIQSVIGYFSIGFLLFGLVLVTVRIVEETRNSIPRLRLFLITLGVCIFLAVIQEISIGRFSYPVLILFLVLVGLSLFLSKDFLQEFTLSYLIIFISAISLYSLIIIYYTLAEREHDLQRLRAVNLVTEHDTAAEIFLSEIQNQINVDSVISQLMFDPYDDLEAYIANTYFSGYFRNYDLQITTCTGETSLDIESQSQTVPCFAFFDEMVEAQGLQIPGTNFYFMDNMNGRISYTGRLHYPLTAESGGVTVYIELNSTLASEGLGYPELLIDRSMKIADTYKRFDYAKYYGGVLVDQHGDFVYNYYINSYNIGPEEYSLRRWGNYEHLIYHTREDNYVIVSRKMYGALEYLISFPYLFVFYFLVSLVFLIAGNSVIRRKSFVFDLRFKIQAAIISIVMVSLLLVAAGTIFYNIEEYESRHREDLNEKMKSIYEEIDMRLYNVDQIDDELKDWLMRELAKLSNVFRTDINIFGTDGSLVATSRPEIYNRGLISTKMNSEAYFELFNCKQVYYLQPEKIGRLSYLSAYQPMINSAGSYLGFINLPYFTRQDKYSQEISTFIVAFINIYVILFLASIIVAIFISNEITKPLSLIRENLRKMGLRKRNEPISYNRDDEIGKLVKEYNKKVEELAASAELLARSERESAWREMAKQVAHEIKNPLTPMKLQIQYLQRMKGSSGEKDEQIERVSKTLIEQIDNLSAIATEFSSFAQIPKAINHVFNLTGQIQKVVGLYEPHDKAEIRLKFAGAGDIMVNADREQLSRAIINLVKNAIQSIPQGQEGQISITVSRRGDFALIEVADNGSGIPEELQDKLFTPSFTTKSSGMGLGLAIVKNIVENFRGRIWFKTNPGSGTSFYIEIPVYNESDEFENNHT